MLRKMRTVIMMALRRAGIGSRGRRRGCKPDWTAVAGATATCALLGDPDEPGVIEKGDLLNKMTESVWISTGKTESAYRWSFGISNINRPELPYWSVGRAAQMAGWEG